MWAHEWIILIGKRQEIKFHDFATFFPSSFTYINPYLFLLLSSLSSSSPKTTKCIIILYNTHTYSFNLTTQLNISPHELCPTWSVKQRWNYSKSTFINILYIHVFFPPSLFSGRPRGMRESPSGRNLPLAVSMTTSQSSTPAAARTARPPGGFGLNVCVWVCYSLINVAIWRPAPISLCFRFWQMML